MLSGLDGQTEVRLHIHIYSVKAFKHDSESKNTFMRDPKSEGE